MGRLQISGQVLYSDLTPAAGATVRISDLDGTGGAGDDLILTRNTDANGRFSGLSDEWQDREGRVFGVDLPDILRLEFTARVDGRTHRGPFLRAPNGRSVPIVMPIPPRKPVSRDGRELVQIILLSPGYQGAERTLYDFIELSTETLTTSVLGSSYRRTTFLKGRAATLAGLVDALRAGATRTGTKAVDLLFTTHGSTDKMTLADGLTSEDTVRDALLDLPDAVRAKLRMVFSTACFGRTHLGMWAAAGFTDASGARGIYADSAVSYAPFLAAWAGERTFGEAVAAANAADVLDAADSAARAFYEAQDEPDTAEDIDSTRVVAGRGRSRIYSTP